MSEPSAEPIEQEETSSQRQTPAPTSQPVPATGMFAALTTYNFRLYAAGQLVSNSGTWMQSVAQGWLILTITGSALAVGLAMALQYLPLLILGPAAGLVVDRSHKRRILLATQSTSLGLALTLFGLAYSGHIHIWQIYAVALLSGFAILFDNPARQAFVQEMVGRDLLANAVSLNSTLMNAGRIVGPAIGALIISLFGLTACFAANAVSYLAVLCALLLMRPVDLHPLTRATRAPKQIRAGLAYAKGNPLIRDILIAVAIVGVFTFNFTTTLPTLMHQTFHAPASGYGIAMIAMGLGGICGGLLAARAGTPTPRRLVAITSAFALAQAALALSPTRMIAYLVLLVLGGVAIAFLTTANSLLQLASPQALRGRIMALYAIGFLGSTPIGAPLMGALCQFASPRLALVTGSLATLGAAWLLVAGAHHHPVDTVPSHASTAETHRSRRRTSRSTTPDAPAF